MGAGLPISLAAFNAVLQAAAQAIDFRPLLKAFRLDVIGQTKRCFDESRTPDGTPWAPLKWPRANSKGGDMPLQDFGILRSSVTAPGADGNIDQQSPTGFVWGTNLDYAGTHQHGATITAKNKFLAIPATTKAKRIGSPRNWANGELKFRFGKRGGVATWQGAVAYYFTRSVTIPKREFLGISAQQGADYEEMAADYVTDQIAKKLGGP